MVADPSLGKQLRTFWDESQVYWNLLASEASLTSPNRQRAVRFVLPGSLLLDLGCGLCANAPLLHEKCRYVGLDASLTALRRPIQPQSMTICGDGENLPFLDSTFDAVLATFVLEHLVDPAKTLTEVLRVVRHGGRVVLVGPAWDFPFWYPTSLIGSLQSKTARLVYTIRRTWGQVKAVLGLGLPFMKVAPPPNLRTDYTWDMDAVYVVWTYEVVRLMRQLGCQLVHWEVENRLLGERTAIRFMKQLLTYLPPYKYSGSPVLLVFQRS